MQTQAGATACACPNACVHGNTWLAHTWHKVEALAGVEGLARQRPGVAVVYVLVPPEGDGGC